MIWMMGQSAPSASFLVTSKLGGVPDTPVLCCHPQQAGEMDQQECHHIQYMDAQSHQTKHEPEMCHYCKEI